MSSIIKVFGKIFMIIFPILLVSMLIYSILGYEFSVSLFFHRFSEIKVDFLGCFVNMRKSFITFEWTASFDGYLVSLQQSNVVDFFAYIGAFFQSIGQAIQVFFKDVGLILTFIVNEIIEAVLLIYQVLCVFVPIDYLTGLTVG